MIAYKTNISSNCFAQCTQYIYSYKDVISKLNTYEILFARSTNPKNVLQIDLKITLFEKYKNKMGFAYFCVGKCVVF